MSKIDVSVIRVPLIIFDSDDWESNEEYYDVAMEIIAYIKETNFKKYYIQNKAYRITDVEISPILMVSRYDCGNNESTFELYIKDIIYELIPEGDEEDLSNG